MAERTDTSASDRRRARIRAFLPLIVFVCLAGFLLGRSVYQKIASGTRVTFTTRIDAEAAADIPVKVDGKGFRSGYAVKFGRRKLTVEDAALEPFERGFMAWWGTRNLGEIKLTRKKGTLTVNAQPTPREITIGGALFNGRFTNGETKFGPIPIGNYTITANFGLFTEQRTATVPRNDTVAVEIKPAVGALDLSSAGGAANVSIKSEETLRVIWEGTTPLRTEAMPVGEYALRASRGEYVRQLRLNIKKGERNQTTIDFPFATVTIDTAPTGAKVSARGKELGATPLTLKELIPGQYAFNVEKDGFMPVTLTGEGRGNETLALKTNLFNLAYGRAMQDARNLAALTVPDYEAALRRVEEALNVLPQNADALAFKSQLEVAFKKQQAERAEEARKQEEVRKKREAELAEATRRQEEARKIQMAEEARRQDEARKKREAELAEQRRQMELARKEQERQIAEASRKAEAAVAEAARRAEGAVTEQARRTEAQIALLSQGTTAPSSADAFGVATKSEPDTEFFDAHSWTVKADLATTLAALKRVLERTDCRWKFVRREQPAADTFVLHCTGETNALSLTKKRAVLVAQKGSSAETRIQAKFFDYVAAPAGQDSTGKGFVPVHPKFFKPEQAAEIQSKRDDLVDEFKKQLATEIK